ncbi:MAG: hypothetical protein ACHQ51_13250 [Elusimicrobiota bacterium]
MKPQSLLPAAAILALALPALAGPKCSPPGSGGASTNWGVDYRERVRQVFDAAKDVASKDPNYKLDPKLTLIFINDLPKQSGTRLVDGSPLSALQKGTLGLETDAVIYTFGVLEIACDEAQLGTFMLHEMKHIQRGPDGKNHLDHVNECRQKIVKNWTDHADLSTYYPAPTGNAARDKAAEKAGNEAAMAAFQKARGNEVATTCVKPVENEADAFAFAKAPQLPYKVEAGDPERDKRVTVFDNAEKWLGVLGISQNDPGHGTLAEREQAAKLAVKEQAKLEWLKKQQDDLQSYQPPKF